MRNLVDTPSGTLIAELESFSHVIENVSLLILSVLTSHCSIVNHSAKLSIIRSSCNWAAPSSTNMIGVEPNLCSIENIKSSAFP